MTSLIICTIDAARRFSAQETRSCAWAYLGKDLARREAVARRLGEKGLLSLGDRLHEVAEGLRQPFLDFIADLGRIQTDQFGWWSSSCSWKDPEASNLFLLICYEHLVGRLVEELEDNGMRLLIVVEDPWLFRQLREAYAGSPEIQFHGRPSLWPSCLRALVRGIGARAVWSARLLGNYLKQRWFWKQDHSRRLNQPSIGLYTYPQARCLRGADGWADSYLGDLDALLEKAGHSVLRFSPPEVGGFERAIGRRSRYFAPLILWATPLSVLRSVTASWRPVWPPAPEVGGLPIRWLLLRDWWLDRWRSSHPIFRVFFDCLSNLLQTQRLKLLIYQYENQPWEKMLVLAARVHGIPTLGYQHGGGLARFMLPYFHGSGESEWAPLPDLVVASGAYSYELLAAGGIPPKRLVMGGNLRHQYVWDARNSTSLPPAAGCVRVLVALPIEPELAQHLICALRRAFPDGGINEGIEFAIKPHPMCPVTEKMLRWPATIVAGTFEEALQSCAVVLYSGTGTGMEAMVMGRVVLRYRSELLLNTDQAEFLKCEAVMDCGDYDLKEKLLSVLHAGAPVLDRRKVDDLLNQVFPPPDSAVWLQAIEQLCSDPISWPRPSA